MQSHQKCSSHHDDWDLSGKNTSISKDSLWSAFAWGAPQEVPGKEIYPGPSYTLNLSSTTSRDHNLTSFTSFFLGSNHSTTLVVKLASSQVTSHKGWKWRYFACFAVFFAGDCCRGGQPQVMSFNRAVFSSSEGGIMRAGACQEPTMD